MKWLDFDPHITFLRLKAVRCVIGVILLMATLITAIIVKYTYGLEWDLSGKGWNNAIEIFRVPLGLLAVSIPLIALFAANHRSVQSKAQMELTQSQIELTQSNNLITNYYKHVDEFQKYVENHVNKLTHIHGEIAQVAYPRKLHKIIFPQAKSGGLRVDENFLKMLCLDMTKVITAMAVFRAERYEHRLTQLNQLNEKIDKLAQKYCVKGHRSNSAPIMIESDGLLMGDFSFQDYIYPFGRICVAITESLLFDESYEAPDLIDQLSRFNWKSISAEKVSNSMNYFFDQHLIDDTMIMLDDEDI